MASPFSSTTSPDFIDDRADEEAVRPNGRDSGGNIAIVDPTTLYGIPVPALKWLVQDWIPMACATGLNGSGGEGRRGSSNSLPPLARLMAPTGPACPFGTATLCSC